MKKQKHLLVGNWKMNPLSADDARHILSAYKRVAGRMTRTRIVACPPYIYLPLAVPRQKSKTAVLAGVQDVYFEKEGAYTGEVSPFMLRDMGASFTIVGHSERRKIGETDEIVSRKASAALAAGLVPIVCVGESEHDDDGKYLGFIREEVKRSIADVPKAASAKLVIAYEPIWAIGAKAAMKPEDIRETALFIKKVLAEIFGHDVAMRVPILYGGSVNWRNAGDIIRVGEVDGLLVGRESVNVPGWMELAKAVDRA